jgi:hypothetical protein
MKPLLGFVRSEVFLLIVQLRESVYLGTVQQMEPGHEASVILSACRSERNRLLLRLLGRSNWGTLLFSPSNWAELGRLVVDSMAEEQPAGEFQRFESHMARVVVEEDRSSLGMESGRRTLSRHSYSDTQALPRKELSGRSQGNHLRLHQQCSKPVL